MIIPRNKSLVALVLGVLTITGGIALGLFIMPHFVPTQVEGWYGGLLIIMSVILGFLVASEVSEDFR
jgi:uncharacterized protein YneF (UPF0154 family)